MERAGTGEEGRKEEREEKAVGVWDCGSPLYDSFELASMSHCLERHVMVLPFSTDDSAGPSGDRPETEVLTSGKEGDMKERRRINAVLKSVCAAVGCWRKL